MTGTVESPEWTPEDRALLLGFMEYERTLCDGGCGQPKQIAWHQDMDGLFDGDAFVCAACTAAARLHNPNAPQVVFHRVFPDPDRPGSLEDLPPLVLGENTIEPERSGA